MQAQAAVKWVRVSPQKARLVVDLIRGQRCGTAITILRATNKRIAPQIEKVLRSAISNAEGKGSDVDVDKLYVKEAYVNDGPRAKRLRPAPMGRAYRVIKRTTHLTVKVAEAEERKAAPAPPARKAAAGKPAAKAPAAKAPAEKASAEKAPARKARKSEESK